MDVNQELKFCENSTKRIFFFFLGGGESGSGGVGWGGVSVDVYVEVKFL